MAEICKLSRREFLLGSTGAVSSLLRSELYQAELKPPLVAAIYWSGWRKGSEFAEYLKDPKWHGRLPFFAEINPDKSVEISGDRPEVMEKEIAYANQAGIDTFAFVYYKRFGDHEFYNGGLNNYLGSHQKEKPGFSLILQGSHVGRKDEWPSFCDEVINLFQNNAYQKVEDSRPLVFLYDVDSFNKTQGGYFESAWAIAKLRKKTKAVGLNNPYIVAQNVSGPPVHFGFDGFGAYTANGGGRHAEQPYSSLVEQNYNFWEQTLNEGKKVVPLLNIGWDARPRIIHPKWGKYYLDGPWYAQPTPDEVTNHLMKGAIWLNRNRNSCARILLCYAWNEFDEGGYIAPTLGYGVDRINAFRRAVDLMCSA